MIDRRAFMKTACVAIGTVAVSGLAGCASTEESNQEIGEAVNQGASQGSATSDQATTAQEEGAMSSKGGTVAVVYFSATGNTQSVAEKIATAADADLMEIIPAQSYSAADLDYNSDCRANTEQNDASARPAIASPIPDVSGFDTVFLGYPIWWGTAPRIIDTFLEGADLAGKAVVPFCTSGSSSISGSLADIEQAAPDAVWEEGRRFSSSASQQEIDEWVTGILG